jgi:hypothetical protein
MATNNTTQQIQQEEVYSERSSKTYPSQTDMADLSNMHGYGESWFENLMSQAQNYKKPQEQLHNYGDSWFENLHDQYEEYERRKYSSQQQNQQQNQQQQQQQRHEQIQKQNYGDTWFEGYEQQWEDWQHVHAGKSSL